MSPKNNRKDILQQLKDLPKQLIYLLAKMFNIPGHSTVEKEELLECCEDKNVKAADLQSADNVSEEDQKKVEEKKMKTTGIISIPEEKMAVNPENAISSAPIPQESPVIFEEPPVWMGEEGPDLPERYNITILQALPRDPHWAYVYWEISDTTKNQIIAEQGEWIFDITTPVLKVYNTEGQMIQEIPVLLDTRNWYVCLPSNQNFSFELGLKQADGTFISLVHSNWIKLPPAEPSHIADEEEWAIIEEKYTQLLKISGGMEVGRFGGSDSAVPHILRQRVKMPWRAPSLQDISASRLWSRGVVADKPGKNS